MVAPPYTTRHYNSANGLLRIEQLNVENQQCYCYKNTANNNKGNTTSKKKKLRRTQHQKKSFAVRFPSSSAIDRIHIIESCTEFSKEEIQNSYLSQSELEQIKLNIRVALMANKNKQRYHETKNVDADIDGADDLRGLESYISKNQYLDKVERLRECRQAVLKQQDRSYDGKIDDRWLMYNYQMLTEQSTDRAYLQGLKDQQCDPASAPFHHIMER